MSLWIDFPSGFSDLKTIKYLVLMLILVSGHIFVYFLKPIVEAIHKSCITRVITGLKAFLSCTIHLFYRLAKMVKEQVQEKWTDEKAIAFNAAEK